MKKTSNESRDNLAFFNLSLELLGMLLQFPEGTQLMHVSNCGGAITIVISHPDFPMVAPGEPIPEIKPWVTEQDGKLVFEPWELSIDQ